MTVRALGAALVLGAVAACAPRPPAESSHGAAASPRLDSARGTLRLSGSDVAPTATLTTTTGRLLLQGDMRMLARRAGLDVWGEGALLAPFTFQVARFAVRGALGDPAIDGILERTAAGFALRLLDGSSHAVRGAPATFGDLVGQRLWMTETRAGVLGSYGVIGPTPGT
ncbi:MAG: hypothetical protein NVS9B3_07270 [Gemmatimonadaceae bacterium]